MNKRICVIGVGRWGMNHAKTLQGLGALAGIVETDERRRNELREQFPDATICPTTQEALAQNFDGFTIATPAQTHFQIASTLLHHRKPVLVEKPITLHVSEARELKTLAERNQTCLMVGHVLLFHPAIQTIRQWVTEGKIGKLQYMYSNRLNLGTVRTEENILWSFAPHDIAIFQYLTESFPHTVDSRGGAFIQPHIHDSTLTVLEYPNNIIGHIFVSWLHPFKEHRLVVIGSKGMLVYEDSSPEKELLFYEKGIDWVQGEPIKRDGPTEVIPYEKKMPLTEELRYFINNLDNPAPRLSNARSGVEVLEVLEQASSRLLNPRETATQSSPSQQKPFFVHETSIVDDPVTIGAGTKIWHFSHIQSGTTIGENCSFGQNVNVGNNVTIGNNVKVQNNVSIYEGVELEDYVFCGPSMVFTNVLDPRSKYPQRGSDHYVKTLVKEGTSIGANATIVCGNTIGRHAFIGAGAVVTKDVPDYALMVGVPARQTGWVCECGEHLPSQGELITCPRCSRQYSLKDGILAPKP